MPRTYLPRSARDTGEVEHRRWMFRHPAVIRITHRVNALCLLVLLMSGLQIFNAHPALYWGKVSTFDTPIMAMSSTEDDPKGITTVLGRIFDTTSYLPVSCRMSFEAVILLTASVGLTGRPVGMTGVGGKQPDCF